MFGHATVCPQFSYSSSTAIEAKCLYSEKLIDTAAKLCLCELAFRRVFKLQAWSIKALVGDSQQQSELSASAKHHRSSRFKYAEVCSNVLAVFFWPSLWQGGFDFSFHHAGLATSASVRDSRHQSQASAPSKNHRQSSVSPV